MRILQSCRWSGRLFGLQRGESRHSWSDVGVGDGVETIWHYGERVDTQVRTRIAFPGERPKPPPGCRGLPASLFIDPAYIAPIIAYLCTDEAAGITNQYFYASGGDICFYPRLLEVPGESVPMFVRKFGKWTLDELSQVIPSLLGQTSSAQRP